MSVNTAAQKSDIRPYRTFFSSHAKANTNVYIVSMDQADEVEKIKKDPDILILDCRRDADPNMQIRQSYKIRSLRSQTAVIRIMLEYNAEYPVSPAWNRTFRSLWREWVLHNIAYRMGVQRRRTGDVDFNNGDEGKGLFDFMRNM